MKEMRSFVVAIVVVATILLGGFGYFFYTAYATPKWAKDGAKMMSSDELQSGEFVLDGHLYTFPLMLSEFLDNGWEIQKDLKDRDTYELEPGYGSSEFILWQTNGDNYIKVKVVNVDDQNAKLKDCVVDYLSISLRHNKLALPGGVCSNTSEKRMLKIYGEALEKNENQGSKEYLYAGYNKMGLRCGYDIKMVNVNVWYVDEIDFYWVD